MNYKQVGERFRKACTELAIQCERLNWAIEDMVEASVENESNKGLESIKKFIKQ